MPVARELLSSARSSRWPKSRSWSRRGRRRRTGRDTNLTVCVNRTPITGEIKAARDKRDIDAFGCGLRHTIAQAPKDAQFAIWLNIMTPYMPITSDGKAPDLEPFLDEISDAVGQGGAQGAPPECGSGSRRRTSCSTISMRPSPTSAATANSASMQRQLFYALRPIVMDETGEELKIGNFTGIITDYEAEHGEIEGMYREPRGSIYHPHRGETITLGTLMVEEYERPAWTFNKLLYIEKEGFSEALKDGALGRAARLHADVVEGLLDPRGARSDRQARRARRAGRRSSASTTPTPTAP